MKIKRFFAKEMRDGIKLVRKDLGAHAVILSNNRVNGGIEIIAAVDYDESLLQVESIGNAEMAIQGKETFSSSDPGLNDFLGERLKREDDKFSDMDFPFSSEFSSSRDNSLDVQFDERFNLKPAVAESALSSDSVVRDSMVRDSIEWSQEPTLVHIQNEINDLRTLLEQQVASLAWGDLKSRNPMRAKLTRGLLEMGLSPELCQRIVETCGQHDDFDTLWRHALATLERSLPVDSADVMEQGGVIAVVGATGVGKTTTIAKLAARYALRHGSEQVAMITTDSYRIAAHEQLRTYGRILDIPVRIVETREELVETIKLFSNRGLVLIDTAGMSQRDVRLSQQFQLIKDSAPAIKTYLVLSTVTHRAGIREVVKAFGEVKLDGCILTKLDETTSLGGALSSVIENQLPIAYVSDGQQVPEDIHIAREQNLVSKAVSVARETSQSLQQETLNLAFSGMVANAHG